jgi:hypothetical protein
MKVREASMICIACLAAVLSGCGNEPAPAVVSSGSKGISVGIRKAEVVTSGGRLRAAADATSKGQTDSETSHMSHPVFDETRMKSRFIVPQDGSRFALGEKVKVELEIETDLPLAPTTIAFLSLKERGVICGQARLSVLPQTEPGRIFRAVGYIDLGGVPVAGEKPVNSLKPGAYTLEAEVVHTKFNNGQGAGPVSTSYRTTPKPLKVEIHEPQKH